jgi:hypothetical protein
MAALNRSSRLARRFFQPKQTAMNVVLLLAFAALAMAGRFSDTLSLTGDAERDFTVGGVLRKGVIRIGDATLAGTQTPVDAPDVGLPPGGAWAGRTSGWDIKNLFFQLDFE